MDPSMQFKSGGGRTLTGHAWHCGQFPLWGLPREGAADLALTGEPELPGQAGRTVTSSLPLPDGASWALQCRQHLCSPLCRPAGRPPSVASKRLSVALLGHVFVF